jgi:ABC-type uncharacterized transport system auxiliary subunit
MPSENEFAYLAGARWEDRPSRMLQRVITDVLEDSDLFGMVTSQGSLSLVDYVLTGELRNFEVNLPDSGDRSVKVTLRVRLSATDGSRGVDASEFTADMAVRSGGTDGVVNAFERAVAQIAKDTGEWILERLSERSRDSSQL